MYNLISNDYLIHHGVKGMKWGVRHDPKPSGRRTTNSNKKKKRLSAKQKRAIKVGAYIVGTMLLTYGAYKVISASQDEGGTKALKNLELDDLEKPRIYEKVDSPKVTFDAGVLRNAVNNNTCGKTINEIDKSLLNTINHGVKGTSLTTSPSRSMNCGACSISYIMNSLFGVKCSAGKDYLMNMQHPFADGIMIQTHGKTMNQLTSSFKDVARTSYLDRDELPKVTDIVNGMKNGTTGILMVNNGLGSHFLNYEKDKNGILTLIDNQNNLIGKKAFDFFKDWNVREYADFSNAKINTNVNMLTRLIMK